MPLGPIIGALAGGLASGAATSLAGRLFGGGGSTTPGASVSGINAGGINATFKNNSVNVATSPLRDRLVGQIAATYPQQASAINDLLGQVKPCFSALRASRLAGIESARRAAVGNLAENLANRKVSGSSFANDALIRANLAYAQQADQIRADTFLQELDLTNQLTAQKYDAARGQFQTALDELNLEADTATQLASQATSQLGANARLEAQLNAQSAAGAGKFFGTVFAPLGDAVNSAVSKFFTPATAAA